MLKLSEVKAILRETNIHPSKRLGQNFLIDQNIQNKIIDSIQIGGEDAVLEIGPGLGALTQSLQEKTENFIAVEKDKRLHEFLAMSLRGCEAAEAISIELINGDILKYDFNNISSKLIVVGNLPYYISSPILNKLIENKSRIKALYATVQMEFGERIVARPGTKDYGSLSCYAQFYGDPKILFKIPRGAFFPVPDVDSCFLRIDFEKQIDSSINQSRLFQIIRSSFEKRRKTILNSLASSGIFESKEKTVLALSRANISPDRRPETISLQEFIILSKA